jgi:hypothetical protein
LQCQKRTERERGTEREHEQRHKGVNCCDALRVPNSEGEHSTLVGAMNNLIVWERSEEIIYYLTA